MYLSRCATPKLGRRRWSTYTVLGFVGYFVATAFCTGLAIHWEFTLAMRVVALVVPPVAFIAVVTVATAIKGREWIVFYQTSIACVVCVAVVGICIDMPVWHVLDCTVLGIGVFLVFGRLGCFHVACCHGRPARRGVVYGDDHAAIGFWRRWIGRPIVPVQLIESVGSGLLVLVAVFLSAVPGRATLVYGVGYAAMRFVLELWRGDPIRPFAVGLSEAQWFALVTLLACGVARPAWWTLGVAVAISGLGAVLAIRRKKRELLLPPHVRAVDEICEQIMADPSREKCDTQLGVSVSCHVLPDGRRDWIMSATHPHWNTDTARRLSELLWSKPEIVEGRTPGLVHVLVSDYGPDGNDAAARCLIAARTSSNVA